MADTMAASIAQLLGAEVDFKPFLRSSTKLLSGGRRSTSAHALVGRRGESEVYDTPPWPEDQKVVAEELGPTSPDRRVTPSFTRGQVLGLSDCDCDRPGVCGSSPSAGARPRAQPASRARAPGRRLNRLGVDPAARDHPRDHGVGVPHLAGRKLVASPDRCRDLRDQVEHAAGTIVVAGQSPRAIYGFGDVRNVPTEPETDLVAEDPKSACHPAFGNALGDHAPLVAAPIVDRRLLDDVLRPWNLHLKCE